MDISPIVYSEIINSKKLDEDISKMKVEDKSLSKANKLVTLMNGTMMISSNYGYGTKVKIILDQKVEFDVNETVAKYEEIYEDIKSKADKVVYTSQDQHFRYSGTTLARTTEYP